MSHDLRAISHSEVESLLSCEAKHAFQYTGHLTGGTTLAPRVTAPILRDGRAWGAGVASYHAEGHGTGAIAKSLQEDADDLREAGLYDEAEFASVLNRLSWMLSHYVEVEPARLALIEREQELLVPIRSRTGRNRSTRFRLHAFLDGVHIDADQRVWIVEFKLRKRLQPLSQIELSRQVRWYAWAWRELSGMAPAGVIVDQRLNDLPGAVAFNQNGDVSLRQSCTEPAYLAACEREGQEPAESTAEKLRAKVWQQRDWIPFSGAELNEAALQITSAAQQVTDMDSGARYPIRNPSMARCPGCQYRQICADPTTDLVDALFHRHTAKRFRSWIGQSAEADQMQLAEAA